MQDVKLGLTLVGALTVLLFAAGSAGFAQPAAAAETASFPSQADEAAIRAVLATYNDALNGGRTEAVLPLYEADGIFMAPFKPSFVGKEAVRQAYDRVFAELKFSVKFAIAEVVPMAPTWAFVRTNSAGTTLHHSSGKTTAEANQELFIFHKDEDGHWRIARYTFSPTNPPH